MLRLEKKNFGEDEADTEGLEHVRTRPKHGSIFLNYEIEIWSG